MWLMSDSGEEPLRFFSRIEPLAALFFEPARQGRNKISAESRKRSAETAASDLIGLHTRSLHLLDYLPNLTRSPI